MRGVSGTPSEQEMHGGCNAANISQPCSVQGSSALAVGAGEGEEGMQAGAEQATSKPCRDTLAGRGQVLGTTVASPEGRGVGMVPVRRQMTNTRDAHRLSHREMLVLTTSSASPRCCNRQRRGLLTPSLPWPLRPGLRGLGPSGNHNLLALFFYQVI